MQPHFSQLSLFEGMFKVSWTARRGALGGAGSPACKQSGPVTRRLQRRNHAWQRRGS